MPVVNRKLCILSPISPSHHRASRNVAHVHWDSEFKIWSAPFVHQGASLLQLLTRSSMGSRHDAPVSFSFLSVQKKEHSFDGLVSINVSYCWDMIGTIVLCAHQRTRAYAARHAGRSSIKWSLLPVFAITRPKSRGDVLSLSPTFFSYPSGYRGDRACDFLVQRKLSRSGYAQWHNGHRKALVRQ